MRCVQCGQYVWVFRNRCRHCGKDQSPYLHLLGVLMGLAGAFIGFTLFSSLGAWLGGLLGVVLYVTCHLVWLRRRAS